MTTINLAHLSICTNNVQWCSINICLQIRQSLQNNNLLTSRTCSANASSGQKIEKKPIRTKLIFASKIFQIDFMNQIFRIDKVYKIDKIDRIDKVYKVDRIGARYRQMKLSKSIKLTLTWRKQTTIDILLTFCGLVEVW